MKVHELTFDLPINEFTSVSNFGKLKVNDKFLNGKIKEIVLCISNRTPGYAKLHVICIDEDDCTFTKKFDFRYTSEVIKPDNSKAILRFQYIEQRKEVIKDDIWYKVDNNLVKVIMRD